MNTSHNLHSLVLRHTHSLTHRGERVNEWVIHLCESSSVKWTQKTIIPSFCFYHKIFFTQQFPYSSSRSQKKSSDSYRLVILLLYLLADTVSGNSVRVVCKSCWIVASFSGVVNATQRICIRSDARNESDMLNLCGRENLLYFDLNDNIILFQLECNFKWNEIELIIAAAAAAVVAVAENHEKWIVGL